MCAGVHEINKPDRTATGDLHFFAIYGERKRVKCLVADLLIFHGLYCFRAHHMHTT